GGPAEQRCVVALDEVGGEFRGVQEPVDDLVEIGPVLQQSGPVVLPVGLGLAAENESVECLDLGSRQAYQGSSKGTLIGRVCRQQRGERARAQEEPILQALQAQTESGRRLALGARRAGGEQLAKPGTGGHGKSPPREYGVTVR